MIFLKRAYEAPSKNDGKRILVDRLWPRGVAKNKIKIFTWMKEVAPSQELRKWFGHNTSKWVLFQRKYRAELKKNTEMVKILRAHLKKYKTITLIYAASDKEHNNAVVLKNFLQGK